jgi:hypothetical protein
MITNFNFEAMFNGLGTSSEYKELDLKPFNLETLDWEMKHWKEYGQLVYPRKKKEVKKFLKIFVEEGTDPLKHVSQEKVQIDYDSMVKNIDGLHKRSRRSSFNSQMEDTLKELNNSIKLSTSSRNINSSRNIHTSANKPPLPPITITTVQRNTSNKSLLGVRKSKSKQSLLSPRENRNSAKSILSQMSLSKPMSLDVIEALKQYSNKYKDSEEIPDTKFIAQFCTYLFQTNIFRNLDQIIELLKEENLEVVNEMRKDAQLRKNIEEGNLESELD